MLQIYEQYIKNIKTIAALNRLDDNIIKQDNDTILAYIKDKSNKINNIVLENNELIKREDFLLYKDINLLTKEDIDNLFEFALVLSKGEFQLDLFLSYHLHLKILQYGQNIQDIPLIIRQNYYCGCTLHYGNITFKQYLIPGFNDIVAQHFIDASKPYINDMDKFDTQTRDYIIRSLANIRLGYILTGQGNYLNLIDIKASMKKYINEVIATWDIFNSQRYKKAYPDIPWFKLTHNYNFNLLSMVVCLRDQYNPIILDILDKARNNVLKDYELENENGEYVPLSVSFQYYDLCVDFALNKIDSDYFIAKLYQLYKDNLDNKKEEYFVKIRLKNRFIDYWLETGGNPKYYSAIEDMMKVESQYYSSFNEELYFPTIIKNINDSLSLYRRIYSKEGINEALNTKLLEFIIRYDLATYVHSCMVSKIAVYLTVLILDRYPDMLEQLKEKYGGINELLHKVNEVGMLHDIGKIGVLNVILFYGRPLFDEEIQLIQAHPIIGACFLKDSGLNDIAQVCLGHHKYYDNNGGYPQFFNDKDSSVKPIIDIISVADSLDAGSDNIGRNYVKAKSVQEIVKEIITTAGTRYNPIFKDLFANQQVVQDLSEYINKVRVSTYIDCVKTFKDEKQINNNIFNQLYSLHTTIKK